MIVGKVFKDCMIKKILHFSKENLDKVRKISLNLTKEREASFYFERIYAKEDAQKAREDAEFVIEFIENILKRK
jgi:HEPN domain-containing protein